MVPTPVDTPQKPLNVLTRVGLRTGNPFIPCYWESCVRGGLVGDVAWKIPGPAEA